jgi:microcystin-dependent protein
MSNVYIGQIIQGGWSYAPRGFHICDGSLLSISQNSALFSLLGTSFGGNGTTTFGLPDLRGRTMVGTGQGPGLSNYVLGQSGGTENTTLTTPNMPAHNHPATFTSTASLSVAQTPSTHQQAQGDNVSMLGRSIDTSPANAVPKIYVAAGSTPAVQLAGLNVAGSVMVGPNGSGTPFSILSPYETVTIVIALEGIFPSRN